MIAKKDVGLPDIGSERFEVSTPVDDADAAADAAANDDATNVVDAAAEAAG